jgi:pyridoxal 5'-phosphate synthase pdxS subunit
MTTEREATKNKATYATKVGLAEMLKGGVIMDVVDADQARLAEEAGACAVMALERVPAEIRRSGGVARATDPALIKQIQRAVSIPVMAKCRIGHTAEARILEALQVDFIDESEVLTIADREIHIDKRAFRAPFVCGCRDLGEALRRIEEGAALIRTKGEAGTGDVVEAVFHLRKVRAQIDALKALGEDALTAEASRMRVSVDVIRDVARRGALPVPQFAAGGIATPADAALCMSLGAEAIFVGSGIFLSANPQRRARAIVRATTSWQDADLLARESEGLGDAMRGVEVAQLEPHARMASREATP